MNILGGKYNYADTSVACKNNLKILESNHNCIFNEKIYFFMLE